MMVIQLLALREYDGRPLHNLAMFNLLGGFNAYVMDFGVGIVYLVGSLFGLESIRFE